MLLFLLPPPASLGAQTAPPFATLQIEAAGVADLGIGRLDPYWGAEHGRLARLSMPFHPGVVAIAFQSSGFEAHTAEQPHFQMRAVTLEYELRAPIWGRAAVGAGGHTGSAFLSFQEDGRFNTDENELVAGVQARLSIGVSRGLAITAGVSHRRVFTRHPIDLTSLAFGLGYTFRTPAALRDFLD